MVDGRELPGRLLPKDEARRIYEEIVRTKRDPALLEYMGRGLYRTSVFPIPPGADRKVTMRYTQLCKRDRDVVEFSYPLSTQKFTAKPIQRLVVELSIQSKDAIKSVYCPSDDAAIERSGDHEVDVRLERHDVVPEQRLPAGLHARRRGVLGARSSATGPSESEDGYFLLLASPEVKPADTRPLPKTVDLRDRPLRLDGRQEDRAGPQGPQVGARTTSATTTSSTSSSTTTGSRASSPSSSATARAAARRPSGSSTTSARGEAPTSTRPSRRPWR